MNKIEKYNLFNSIISNKYKTKFPYNEINKEKLIFTKSKINLLIKKPTTDKIGGYSKNINFTFY